MAASSFLMSSSCQLSWSKCGVSFKLLLSGTPLWAVSRCLICIEDVVESSSNPGPAQEVTISESSKVGTPSTIRRKGAQAAACRSKCQPLAFGIHCIYQLASSLVIKYHSLVLCPSNPSNPSNPANPSKPRSPRASGNSSMAAVLPVHLTDLCSS